MATKEEVYDAEISPLMAQIIAIAKREKIPFHAGFALDGDLACTTHIDFEAKEIPEGDRETYDAWVRHYRPVMRYADRSPLMITTRNAAGDVVLMEAVL